MKADMFGGIKTNRVKVIVSCLFIIACCILPVAAIVDESLTVPQIQGKAFPEGEAGLAAYINTSQNIDLEKIKTIFSSVDEVGDNYIIGVVPISDWCKTINTHVYVDTTGWMVAYFKKGEPASGIMQWGSGETDDPSIGVIKSTTLEDALYIAGNTAGVGLVSTDINYYDFEFPNADKMMIVAKTQATHGSSIFQLELPSTYTLYEDSYYYFERYYTWHNDWHDYWTESSLKIDDVTISVADTAYIGDKKYGCWAAVDQLKGAIATGKLHTISISHIGHNMGSAGVAIVLIYKAA